MKKLTYIILLLLIIIACSKDDDPLYEPQNLIKEQKEIDRMYAGLDAMATDNGYDSIPDLLEGESWKTGREEKYLIRNVIDTFYAGILPTGNEWSFRFVPYPFNYKEIIRRTTDGSLVKEGFEPMPSLFKITNGTDYKIIQPTRYIDSTLSFELRRETQKDSIITVEYFRLQTEL